MFVQREKGVREGGEREEGVAAVKPWRLTPVSWEKQLFPLHRPVSGAASPGFLVKTYKRRVSGMNYSPSCCNSLGGHTPSSSAKLSSPYHQRAPPLGSVVYLLIWALGHQALLRPGLLYLSIYHHKWAREYWEASKWITLGQDDVSSSCLLVPAYKVPKMPRWHL